MRHSLCSSCGTQACCETVRIRRSGYGAKYTFQEFTEQFRVLLPKNSASLEDISSLLHRLGFDHTTYQIGKTKVYLKELERQTASGHPHKDVMRKIIFLQHWFRAKIERMDFIRMREAAILIQVRKEKFYQRQFLIHQHGECSKQKEPGYQKAQSHPSQKMPGTSAKRGISARKRLDLDLLGTLTKGGIRKERDPKRKLAEKEEEEAAQRAKEAEEAARQAKKEEEAARHAREEQEAARRQKEQETLLQQPLAPGKQSNNVETLVLERSKAPVDVEIGSKGTAQVDVSKDRSNSEIVPQVEAGPPEVKEHQKQKENESSAHPREEGTQTKPTSLEIPSGQSQNRAPPLAKLPVSRSQEKRELRRQRGLEHSQRESERAALAGKDNTFFESKTLERPGKVDSKLKERSDSKELDQYTFVAWKVDKVKKDAKDVPPELVRPSTLPLDIPNSGPERTVTQTRPSPLNLLSPKKRTTGKKDQQEAALSQKTSWQDPTVRRTGTSKLSRIAGSLCH
ncbi:unconventional myosin-IXb-like [Carassius auratus]|uniref:Unconventional myosin-IXb-like n=1 Tax=Carassius auratus TaxID=7957 RepID=A0A6P6NKB2_CARAU|nr:unconventional myosin-IXb-like [Carassius auratus]